MCKKFFLVFLLAALVLGACSRTQQNAQSAAASGDDATFSFPRIAGTPAKIRVFAAKNPDVLPFDQLKTLGQYSAQVGVEVEWENPPATDGGERFNLIVASGTLPDIFWGINATQYNTLYSLKALAPLSAHIEKVATNLKARMAEYPNDTKYFKDASTGEIYMLPFYDELTTNGPLVVRGDWLEKLNLSEPVTLADWETVWKAIKEGDPNGNGQADEIPFSTGSMGNLRTFVAAFGMLDTFYVDAKGDGRIHYANIESRYRDFLAWISDMYAKGYIDQEIASTTGTIFQGKVAENIVGSFRGTLNGNLNAFNTTIAPKIEGFKYIGTAPAVGPYGDQIHPGCVAFVRNDMIGGVVTTSSKVPEICVAYVDAFYDKSTGSFIADFGEEGVSFTVQNGAPIFTDYVLRNPDGRSPMQALGSMCFMGNGPAFSMSTTSFQMWHPLTAEAYGKIVEFYDESIPYVVQALPFTAEEDAERRAMIADITTFVDESVINFITGVKPMGEFDAYVRQINSMGMPRLLELYNTAYERWNR